MIERTLGPALSPARANILTGLLVAVGALRVLLSV